MPADAFAHPLRETHIFLIQQSDFMVSTFALLTGLFEADWETTTMAYSNMIVSTLLLWHVGCNLPFHVVRISDLKAACLKCCWWEALAAVFASITYSTAVHGYGWIYSIWFNLYAVVILCVIHIKPKQNT